MIKNILAVLALGLLAAALMVGCQPKTDDTTTPAVATKSEEQTRLPAPDNKVSATTTPAVPPASAPAPDKGAVPPAASK